MKMNETISKKFIFGNFWCVSCFKIPQFKCFVVPSLKLFEHINKEASEWFTMLKNEGLQNSPRQCYA